MAISSLLTFASTVAAQTDTSSPPPAIKRVSYRPVRTCFVGQREEIAAAIDTAEPDRAHLSSTEDWDCDGIADRFDNCIGMSNRTQTDADGNGIGDTCEAAATVRLGIRNLDPPSAKPQKQAAHSKPETRSRKAKTVAPKEKKAGREPDRGKRRTDAKKSHKEKPNPNSSKDRAETKLALKRKGKR
jgi:hypothetical protein